MGETTPSSKGNACRTTCAFGVGGGDGWRGGLGEEFGLGWGWVGFRMVGFVNGF